MSYWLLKSEPDTFGIQHLENSPNQVTSWEGVRNYQARNLLRDEIKAGDLAFFYHSSCKVPGIAGVVKIIRSGYPDVTALDPLSSYYDPKSSVNNPRWYTVDVQLVKKLADVIPLQALRKISALKNMVLLRPGNRLSVTPVTSDEWQAVVDLYQIRFE